jgi:hypothetical protein
VTSIYQRVLGDDFARLHPKIQERFGFSSADGVASIGTGVMDEIWRGPAYTLPFLRLGSWRNLLFPERGSDVPFTVENYAYVDRFGRETVTWVRTFEMPTVRRRFDATMIYSESRDVVVDYMGTHQHLAVDLALSVADNGGLRLTSGEQRFYEGPIAFRFPLALSGDAEVVEWYDDATERFAIDVRVTNRHLGPLFGYRGTFTADRRDVRATGVPLSVKPVREERRE